MKINKLGKNVSQDIFILNRLWIAIIKMIRASISFINKVNDSLIYKWKLIHWSVLLIAYLRKKQFIQGAYRFQRKKIIVYITRRFHRQKFGTEVLQSLTCSGPATCQSVTRTQHMQLTLTRSYRFISQVIVKAYYALGSSVKKMTNLSGNSSQMRNKLRIKN